MRIALLKDLIDKFKDCKFVTYDIGNTTYVKVFNNLLYDILMADKILYYNSKDWKLEGSLKDYIFVNKDDYNLKPITDIIKKHVDIKSVSMEVYRLETFKLYEARNEQ